MTELDKREKPSMGDELTALDIDAWVAWAESDEPTRSGVDMFGDDARELGVAAIRQASTGDDGDESVM